MDNLQLKIAPLGEAQSLKARAYEALKAAILNMNIYDANAELRLDERQLSAQFGVSRTPLREALAQLDQEGLVRIVARRGIYIVRKTKAEILEMITVWAALESMAARLATKEATDAEIASLHDLIDAFSTDEVARKMGEYSDANIRFHQEPSSSRFGPGGRWSITWRSWPRSKRATRSGRSGSCASTRSDSVTMWNAMWISISGEF